MANALVSTKLTDADKKEEAVEVASPPDYPWGMRLRFDDVLMKKIGLTDVPEVDDILAIIAKGRVCEVWSRDGSNGEDAGFEVVIEEICVNDPDEVAETAEAKPSAASVLFDAK